MVLWNVTRNTTAVSQLGYLIHGMGQTLWPSFLTQLEASPYAEGDTGPVIEGAHDAFAAFERAAPPGAETRGLADVTAP